MDYWHAVLAFVVAGAIAAVLTPLAARLARMIGAVDAPRERGLAARETPLLGGLAILSAVLICAAVMFVAFSANSDWTMEMSR